MKRSHLLTLLLLTASPMASASQLVESLNAIADLAITISAFAGLIFLFGGIYGYYADTKAGREVNHAFNITAIFAGIGLISALALYSIVRASVVGEGQTLRGNMVLSDQVQRMMSTGSSGPFSGYIPADTQEALLAFVFLIGLFSFLRSFWLAYSLYKQNARNGENSVMRILAHMLAGILLMNITWTACWIGKSFSIPFLCMG